MRDSHNVWLKLDFTSLMALVPGASAVECGSMLISGRKGHDPETAHRPKCEFLKGQSDNVPVDSQQQKKTEESTQEEKQNKTNVIKPVVKVRTNNDLKQEYNNENYMQQELLQSDIAVKFSNTDEYEKQHHNSVVPNGSQPTGLNAEKPTNNSGNDQEFFTCKTQSRVVSSKKFLLILSNFSLQSML